jgi:hypothetical protein
MAAFLLAGGVASASLTVVLPESGGSGFPDGSGANFPNTYESTNPLALLDDYTSTVSGISTPVPGDPGAVYDLKFFIETKVYQTAPGGTLDFVYQVHNVSDDNESTTFGDIINRLTLESFANYGVTANYIYGNGGVGSSPNITVQDMPPVDVDRSGTNGSVVGYDFDGYDAGNNYHETPLLANTFSDQLVVRTDATAYSPGTATVDGGHGLSNIAQVPYPMTNGVPEPASLGVLAISGAALLGRRRPKGL